MEDKFKVPFRIGKKQSRAVLDDYGKEVVIFRKGLEFMALEYINFINDKYMKDFEVDEDDTEG